MSDQYQIQAAKSSLVELQLQFDDLCKIMAKEYDAPWLKNAESVVRDASGRFSKKAGSAASSAMSSVNNSVTRAVKNAEGEVISKYGADAERVAKKAGEIKDSIASHVASMATDISSARESLSNSLNQMSERIKNLPKDTRDKLSSIMSSPAVVDRMTALSSAMGNISDQAKQGYDSAVSAIVKTKGDIESKIKAASDFVSNSKIAKSIIDWAKPVSDAMHDMGEYVANQLFYSYIGAMMSAKNLANIVANGDSSLLQKLYSLPLPDGGAMKNAIAPLLNKMKKWSNTAPKALQEKYASTIKSIDSGFNESFKETTGSAVPKSIVPGRSGDFGNQTTNA